MCYVIIEAKSRFVNREPGCLGATCRVGKPDQIGEIQVISGMLKCIRHYVLAPAGRSIRLGQI